MASNKNQHFVPKVYLRPFGNADDRSINLYAFGPDRCVEGASIKGQCSRNFFYGTDPKFEEFLQYFEGRYGEVIARLQQGEVKETDIVAMFSFFVLQHLRTPHMLANRLDVVEAFRNTIIGGKALHEVREDAQRPTDLQREMQEQIYIAAKAGSYFDDLTPVFLINRSKIPFITSDNPACLTNRLYTQRYGDATSGMIQSGAAIFLPLTAQLAFMGYDGDVFHPVSRLISHEVRNAFDVNRLNELQAQVATGTLFFTDWSDSVYVQRLAHNCKGMRRETWSHIWTSIKDGEDAEYERFRAVTEADNESKEARVTSVSMYNPAPSTWPSFLRFKLRPKGFTTGSAVGFVRAAHATEKKGPDFRQVVLPASIPKHHTPEHREVMWMRKNAAQDTIKSK